MTYLLKNIMVIALLITSTSVFAQRKIETTFKVDGECNMCKKRIEKALDVPGVIFAEWNIEKKEAFVVYKPKKISIDEIHQHINAVGHDTERSLAPDSVYEQIHHCCRYRVDKSSVAPSDTIDFRAPEHYKRHK
jgi:periplasmic mercuric ion binding protein